MSHSSAEHGAVTHEEAVRMARKGIKVCLEGGGGIGWGSLGAGKHDLWTFHAIPAASS